jgi:2-amino-4-hydroxy-6-hydroxymethyldihydropteridine diphosphokinase
VSRPILITFGANIDPLNNLYQGLTHLHRAIKIAAISTVWLTQPVPDPEAPQNRDLGESYLNGAILSFNPIAPFDLRTLLKKIETDCHRVRSPNRFAARSLDLDIALMGEEVVNEPLLSLPDPDILHRPFIALPLAQLLPDQIHPLENRSLIDISRSFYPLDEAMVKDDEATKMLQSLIR